VHEFIIIIARLPELYFLHVEYKNRYAVYYIDLSLLFALVTHFRNVYQRLVKLLPWQYIWGFNKEILSWYFVLLKQSNRKKILDFVYPILTWLIWEYNTTHNQEAQIHPETKDRWRDDNMLCNGKLFILHKVVQCHHCDVLIYK